MKLKLREIKSGVTATKRVSRLTKKQRSIAVIALVLAAVFAAVYTASLFGIIPLDAAAAKLSSGLSGDKKRFPVSVDSESVVNMAIIGDRLLILYDKQAVVMDKSGKEVYTAVHTFSKPAVSVNGKSAVVFDRNGKGFMLLTDSRQVYTGEADDVIVSAEYGKCGNYALATRSDEATTVLTVFDKHGTVVFKWACAYEYITAIALSDSGKYVGTVSVSAENGDIYAKVNYFGFDYKEPFNTQKIVGTAPLGIEFTSSDTLTLFGDNGIYTVQKKAEKYEEIVTYYSSEFNSFAYNSGNGYALSLAKYGSTNLFEITRFTRKGKIKMQIEADFKVICITMSDKYIFALAENEIMVYNLSGKQVGSVSFEGDVYNIFPTDGYIFIHSLDKITRAFSYGNS